MLEYIEGIFIIILLSVVYRLHISNENLLEENEMLWNEAQKWSPRLAQMGRMSIKTLQQ
jgi:hypothetical protein